ncbi:hypothetical protein [Okeania sp.]|uniref:hypothetical protein n=1 Tax=Okeania sp. TaxID=3100323 RepID=UPI002B4B43A8|nr:hypothetical protein [Okeania sp.]MEB3342591.1 hypothetical protein [Okeania sp.]
MIATKHKAKSSRPGRPGGNPGISKYAFQAKNPEKPNKALLALRIDSNDLATIKNIPNWQDKVRAKLEELLQEEAIAKKSQTHSLSVG